MTSASDGGVDPNHYIYVDWGPAFAANHQAAFPNLSNPPISISLGPLALTYLLTVGGSGYFRSAPRNPFSPMADCGESFKRRSSLIRLTSSMLRDEKGMLLIASVKVYE